MPVVRPRPAPPCPEMRCPVGLDRLEVVRLREARAAAARDRARLARGERRGMRGEAGEGEGQGQEITVPGLPPPSSSLTPRSLAARTAEVARAKRGLERLGFAPELTEAELGRVLP